jgi:3-hydroxybutyryl-CoA dehydrogenase
MSYVIVQQGESRSFPKSDPFLADVSAFGEVVLILGAPLKSYPDKAAVLVELGNECLAEHTNEKTDANVLGFARYRNGADAPSKLIELVRGENSSQTAIDAATAMFKSAGFTVAVCADQAGRIVDRLVRPKYNAALRFLDEGLATQADMDLTCRLGLGYADGPIERVVRGGLAHHYDVTKALFEIYGTSAYAPARRAAVAKAKQK